MKQHQPMQSNRWRDYSFNPALLLGGCRADLFSETESETMRKVGRSVAYMLEHLNEPLQVATLAAQANVSPSHYFALFKQQMGCPPMDYFTKLRMRHACRLFESTSASVKEVAAALGYDDPFYFSRVFKSIHQIPPSRYRTAKTQARGWNETAALPPLAPLSRTDLPTVNHT